MKATTFALAALLISNLAFAASDDDQNTDIQDTTETEVALENEAFDQVDKDTLKELTSECREFASEDAVETNKLKQYLLDCVNKELENMGYKPVKSLNPPR